MRRHLLAAAALAAVGFALPAAAQCDTRFVLVNNSSVTVREFYFGPSSNPNWGPDQLGANVLAPGQSVAYQGAQPGAYDFRVVWMNGQASQVMGANICVLSRVIATNNGLVVQ
jgi:hypothetical protein